MSFLMLFVSVLIVFFIGLLLGLIIATASRFLAVKKEERIEQVEAVLPGANCGACGFAGCAAYAEAVVLQGVSADKCTSLTTEGLARIAEITGREAAAVGEPQKAFIACHAQPFDPESQRFDYEGLSDCISRSLYYKGPKKCNYGCLGGGSCIDVCPVQAIYREKSGRVCIDREKCISCRKCVAVCPMNIIQMIPQSADYAVACSHPGKAAAVKQDCAVGCLGCTLCTKKSPDGGFFMDGFLAKVDYNKNGSREEAVEKCPSHCIVSLK